MVTPQTNTTLEQIAEKFLQLDNFVICGHENPDGDCLGSTLGLYFALKQLGKHVVPLYSDGEISHGLQTINGYENLIKAQDFVDKACVFVMVDAPHLGRMSASAAEIFKSASITFTIDHHAHNERVSEVSYTDPDAPAASLIIWDLVHFLKLDNYYDIAQCTYLGLMTDTGCFQFQNTNAKCFHAASEMIEAGVNPGHIASNVLQNRPLSSLKLENIALSRMTFDKDAGFVLSYLKKEDFDTCGATKADADPIIDTLRSIYGVRVACMLREQEDCVRGSLRAKDDTDVAAIALSFNGGGHKAAAGLTMYCSIQDACCAISEAIVAALK